MCGSLAHLVAEAGEDVVASAPSTRSSQLQDAVETGRLSTVVCPDGRRVYVRDAAPTSSQAALETPVALVIGAGLSASTNLVESLRSQGLRVIAAEEDLETPAAGTAAASGIAARSELISAVLNDRGISGRVVVVAGGLEWLPALHFCMRNQAHVQGLLVVDPILPGFHQIDGLQEEAALESAAAPSPLTAASMAIRQAVAAPSFALKISSFDPLHILEHMITGSHHHHLFCGSDHGAAQYSAVRTTTAAKDDGPVTDSAVYLPGTSGVRTRWRGAASNHVAASPAPAAESDDTVDCTALHTEAVYRSLLYGLDHAPSLAEMLPTVGQSIAPTLARSGLHLGIIDTKPDPRIAALDARVAANAQACADPALRSSWIGSLQTLSEALPVRVRITVPGEADVAQKRGELTEAELELRLRLQADAGRRLGHWHSVLPRRVAPVACAGAASGRDIFEPDSSAVASATAALAAAVRA